MGAVKVEICVLAVIKRSEIFVGDLVALVVVGIVFDNAIPTVTKISLFSWIVAADFAKR